MVLELRMIAAQVTIVIGNFNNSSSAFWRFKIGTKPPDAYVITFNTGYIEFLAVWRS